MRTYQFVLLSCLVAAISSVSLESQNIYTVAGSGQGTGLKFPQKMSVDSNGNTYIADGQSFIVYKLASDNTISLFAGTGTSAVGTSGGLATQVSLSSPEATAVDSSNNIYIADGGDCNCVWKVDAGTGHMTLITGHISNAGMQTEKFSQAGDGGPSSSAIFSFPSGMAIDSTYIYVFDGGFYRIRRFPIAGGTVATVAGNGCFTPGQANVDPNPGNQTIFHFPMCSNTALTGATQTSVGSGVDLTSDGMGNFFFPTIGLTNGNALIYKFTVGGNLTKIGGVDTACTNLPAGGTLCWNGASNSSANNVNLGSPTAMVYGNGKLYYAGSDQRIAQFGTDGTNLLSVAGNGDIHDGNTGDGGLATNAGLEEVSGIGVRGSTLILDFVAALREFTVGGTISSVTVPGAGHPDYQGDGGPAVDAKISNEIFKVQFDSAGNMYIPDAGNQVIRKVDAATKIITTVAGKQGVAGPATSGVAPTATGFTIQAFGIDANDFLYIAEPNNGNTPNVWRFKVGGTVLAATTSTFGSVTDMSIDHSNNVYIAEAVGQSDFIEKFVAGGTASQVNSAAHNYQGIGVSSDGTTLYATENENIVGNNVPVELEQILPSVSVLRNPNPIEQMGRVAADPLGGAFLTEGNIVYRWTPGGAQGNLTAIAGQTNPGFGGDNAPAVNSSLNTPLGLSLDSLCNLYIADSDNQRIRVVPNLVNVTVTSSPTGANVIVDGNNAVSPQTAGWESGSSHTLNFTSPQTNGGTKYLFLSWSQGGAQSQTLAAPGCVATTTYTANVQVQYQLTTAASTGGTVTPASGTFYNSGTVVNLQATPSAGYRFSNWTGSAVASSSSAATTVTMSAPESVTGNFILIPDVTVTAGHTGTFTQGQTGTVTVAVHNIIAGSVTAGTTMIVDTLPLGWSLSSFSGSGWGCSGASNVVTCTSTQAVSGDFPVLSLVVNVPAASSTSVSHGVTVSGATETNTSNDSSTDGPITVIQTPATVTAMAGTPQTAMVSTAYATALRAAVVDAASVVIPNASVTFTITAGGTGASGTFGSSATVPADMNGIATAPTLMANASPGAFTVTATAGGHTAMFNLRNIVSTPPTNDSVTGIAAGASPQTLTFKYSSVNGYGYLTDLHALLNSAITSNGSCWIDYNQPTNTFYLLSDGVTAAQSFTAGAATSISNGQCTLIGAHSSVSGSGNTLTVILNISFMASFGNSQGIYMYAADAGGLGTGWQQKGSTAGSTSTPPTADSVTGISAGSLTQSGLVLQYSSVNGAGYLMDTYALFNGSLSGANGCLVLYDKTANGFYLMNDAGNALLGPVAQNAGSSLSNAQCTLNASTVSLSNNALTMNLNVTFSAAFGAAQMIYMYAADAGGLNSGWQQKGSTGLATAPTADSVTGMVPGVSTQLLTMKYSSANGFHALSDVYVLFNPSLSGLNACWIFYDKAANGFYLVNDAGTGFLGPLAVGSNGTLANTQCTLNGSNSMVSGSMNTLTVTLSLIFNDSFGAAQNIFMYAADESGQNSGWRNLGTLTLR